MVYRAISLRGGPWFPLSNSLAFGNSISPAMESIFPVDQWSLEGERSFIRHRYNLADATEDVVIFEHRRCINNILASCDVSNPTQAIRTVAVLATTFQFITSHISKVTAHIINNEAIYRRIPESQDEWPILLKSAHRNCLFTAQFWKMLDLMEGLIKAFKEYSTDDSHPYFEHRSKLVPLRNRLRRGCLQTYSSGFQHPMYTNTYQVHGIAASVRHYREEILPELHSSAVSLRGLVLVFNDIGKYSRSLTLEIVKRFPPGSPKRHEAILLLDQQGRAARSSVYEELKSESECNNMIIHDEWKRSHRHSTVYSPGCILIDLCPVLTTMSEISKRCRFETAHVTMDIFSPQCHCLRSIYHRKGYRYYFCPRRFPPPYDADKIWDCESFNRLMWYIKHCSKKADSPVYYNGGKGGLSRRFLCTRKNRARKGCKYGFSVSCDMLHGYYIVSGSLSSYDVHDCRGSLEYEYPTKKGC